ncbi:nucleotidyltransferase family protein [Kitasatospora sp. NPDC058243]|uniref:nucleotidyltransferase family protein n=1 Tax=Kitasatospora sp. NPDC058243 TaxID=3346397 RepID=UPI0036D8D3B6
MTDSSIDDSLTHGCLEDLSPEARLLLALARPRLEPAQQQGIFRFLTANGQDLDWGLLVDQACRHGVLPLIGRNLLTYRLVHSADGRSLAPYRWIYAYAYEGNRRRNHALADEYAKVIRGLNAGGLDYAIRKGPVLTEGVYGDVGLRRMGDLDVLLSRDSLPEFTSVVEGLGYRQGHLSGNAELVVPFDRRTQMVWKVSLANSTLPYLKPAQRDDVEVFVLDPCFNVFQPGSGAVVDPAEILARAVDAVLFGEASRRLDAVDQFIDVCVQLHVEATTLMYIEIGKDLTILKFLDLVQLLNRLSGEQLETLVSRVRRYGCADSIRYALHHTGQVFPDGVPPALTAELGPADPDLLETYGVLDGRPDRWEQGFADRLFNPRRSRTPKARSTVPGPRAVV